VQTPVVSQVLQFKLHGNKQLIALSEHVAHLVESQYLHYPSIEYWPVGQELHWPLVLQVLQPLLQGIVQLVGELLQVAQTVLSHNLQVLSDALP